MQRGGGFQITCQGTQTARRENIAFLVCFAMSLLCNAVEHTVVTTLKVKISFVLFE